MKTLYQMGRKLSYGKSNSVHGRWGYFTKWEENWAMEKVTAYMEDEVILPNEKNIILWKITTFMTGEGIFEI